jgi:hypothetical protein
MKEKKKYFSSYERTKEIKEQGEKRNKTILKLKRIPK